MTTSERCTRPLVFPKRLYNRPALPRIDYRVGTYSDFRAHLIHRLNATAELAHWTHREPDDPGIALLECAAVLGDVLTFYQELYANEAYLRTARWRTSVAELVRLLGYRLAPGLGGRGTFAFEVRPGAPVTVPAGFPLEVELEGADEPATFETLSSLVAYPELSRFHLFRPLTQPQLAKGTTELWIRADEPIEIEEDDRLLLAVPAGDDSDRLESPQIVVVEKVTSLHGATIVRIQGALQRSTPVLELIAYKLGRTFRHFGHSAPRQEVTISGSQATAAEVSYCRSLTGTTSVGTGESLPALELPLAGAVDDFAAGREVVCTYGSGCTPGSSPWLFWHPLFVQGSHSQQSHAIVSGGGGGDLIFGASERLAGEISQAEAEYYFPGVDWGVIYGSLSYRTVVRTVAAVRGASLRWGSLTGPATVLTLDRNLATGGATTGDVRTFEIHEVVSPRLHVRARPVDDNGLARGKVLYFHGPAAAAEALDGRRVMLAKPGAEAVVATATTVEPDTPPVPYFTGLHRVVLDVEVDYADFPQQPEEETAVTVHGNLADADQGESQREAVLGSGDSRRAFQTFELPKAPLTYHYAPAETPPQAPELEVWVAGRRWERVESLYGQGAEAEVYIVREDAEGRSWVQFGDGRLFGARPPSGVDNVVARLRTGIGARGRLAEGTKVQAGRLDRLDAVAMPGVISGGDGPEGPDHARAVAPGRVQSLGRLVGLRDFESEALAIAGVARAAAAWELVDGVPAVVVTVLMEGGREEEHGAVAEALRAAARERGPDRFEIHVRQGRFLDLLLHVQLAVAAGFRAETVRAEVESALGVTPPEGEPPAGGLFSLARRHFGQGEHASRVTGVVQNVPGVAWVEIVHFQGLEPAEELVLPATPERRSRIECPAACVLRLRDRAEDSPFRLNLVSPGGGGGS